MQLRMNLTSISSKDFSVVGKWFHFLMYGAPARHVVRGRALPYLIYDLVALLPWNRTSREKGVFVCKEVLNANPNGIYVTLLAQEVGTGFLVSHRSNADGGHLLFETSQVGATLLAFHRPCHRSSPR